MQQKSESTNPSLEEIIDKLKQENLCFFEKADLFSQLVESLNASPETPEDKVKWLLGQQLSHDIINNLFCAAAKKGHLDMVQYLITLPGVDPTAQNNYAIRGAAENGHLEVVQYLMTLPGVDPTAKYNYAICWAAVNGHLDVVKYLMTLPDVNPAARDNFAICWAAAKGHLEVVQYLRGLRANGAG